METVGKGSEDTGGWEGGGVGQSASWGQKDNIGHYVYTTGLRQALAKHPAQGFYSEPPETWLP